MRGHHMVSLRVIYWILDIVTSEAFYNRYVKPPPNRTPSEIRDNSKLSLSSLIVKVLEIVPILIYLYLTMLFLTIETGKVAYHRMSLLLAYLTYASHIFSVAGRAVQQMELYIRMLEGMILPSIQEHIRCRIFGM